MMLMVKLGDSGHRTYRACVGTWRHVRRSRLPHWHCCCRTAKDVGPQGCVLAVEPSAANRPRASPHEVASSSADVTVPVEPLLKLLSELGREKRRREDCVGLVRS